MKNGDSFSPISPRRCETTRNSSWWQMDVHFEKEHRPLWWLHPSSNNSFVGMFDVTRFKYSIIQTPILTRQHSPEETYPPLFSLSYLLFTLHVFCFSLCFTLPVHSNRVSGPYKAACSSLRCCRSVFFFFLYLHSNLITNLYFSRQLPLLPADAHFKSVSEAQCSKGSIPSLGRRCNICSLCLTYFYFLSLVGDLIRSGVWRQKPWAGLRGRGRYGGGRERLCVLGESQQQGNFTAALSANTSKNIKVICPQAGSSCTHLI